MSLNVKEAVFAIECFRIEQLTAGRGMDEPVLEYWAYSSARVAFHSGMVEKKPKYNRLNPTIPEH